MYPIEQGTSRSFSIYDVGSFKVPRQGEQHPLASSVSNPACRAALMCAALISSPVNDATQGCCGFAHGVDLLRDMVSCDLLHSRLEAEAW
jgi:hypothetical protein